MPDSKGDEDASIVMSALGQREQFFNEVMATESNWLRNAKFEMLRRDPVDACNDAEALAEFTRRLVEGTFQSARRLSDGADT